MHATHGYSNLEEVPDLEDMVMDLVGNHDNSLIGSDSSNKNNKLHKNDTPAHDFDNNLALDTGGNSPSVQNKKVVTSIRKTEHPILMCTKTGERKINEVSKIIGIDDKAWADEESMANMICFSKMPKQYGITYDNKVEDAFLIHTPEGVVKFERTREGLSRHKLTKEYLAAVAETKKKTRHVSRVTTVAENWGNYHHNYFEQAKKAQKICHIVGAPSGKNFKMTLRCNQMCN